MKVKKLFVIAITSSASHDESMIEGTVLGLAAKHSDKIGKENVRLVHLRVTETPSSSNWLQSLQLGNQGDLEAIKAACSETGDIGVYCSLQGKGRVTDECPDFSNCMEPRHFAQLFKALGFTKLRKLCLICCNVGKSAGQQFCRFLSSTADVQPMIAGWSSFVTAYNPGKEKIGERNVYDRGHQNQKVADMQPEARGKLIGSKVAQASNNSYVLVSREEDQGTGIRNAYQWLYQYDTQAKAVRELKPAEWTDKKKS